MRTKLESKTLDNTSCIYPNITSRFQTNRSFIRKQKRKESRLQPKTNVRNVESNLKRSYIILYVGLWRLETTEATPLLCALG